MSYARTAVTRMTLDMSRLDLQRSETVTLGDTNRRWEVTLINGGAPFRLPPNWTAALTGIKPDGTGLLNGCSVADGKIIYDFAAGKEIATCAGSYPVQFDIWDEVGDLVASPKVYVNVLADVRPHAELESDGQYTLIGETLTRVAEAEKDINENAEEISATKKKVEENQKQIEKLAPYRPSAVITTIPTKAWEQASKDKPYTATFGEVGNHQHVTIWGLDNVTIEWLNVNRPTVSIINDEICLTAAAKPSKDLTLAMLTEPYSVGEEGDEGDEGDEAYSLAELVGLTDEAVRLNLGKRMTSAETRLDSAEVIGGLVEIKASDWDNTGTTIKLPIKDDTLTLLWPDNEVSTTIVEKQGIFINQAFVDDDKDEVLLIRVDDADYKGALKLRYIRFPMVNEESQQAAVLLIGAKYSPRVGSGGGNGDAVIVRPDPHVVLTIAADSWSETKSIGLTTWITGAIPLDDITPQTMIRLSALDADTAADWSAGQTGAEITHNEETETYSLRVGIIGDKPTADWQILMETSTVEETEGVTGPWVSVIPPVSDATDKVADHNYDEAAHPDLRDQIKGLDAKAVGADPAGTAESKTGDLREEIDNTLKGYDNATAVNRKINEHNVSTESHEDLRQELQRLADRLNAALNSDDTSLDDLKEIVAYIKSNKTLIDGITSSKVNVTDIVDNLVTNKSNVPLSAAQGVALKLLIDSLEDVVEGKTTPDQVAAQIKTALTPYITREDADKAYQPAGDYVAKEEGKQLSTLDYNASEQARVNKAVADAADSKTQAAAALNRATQAETAAQEAAESAEEVQRKVESGELDGAPGAPGYTPVAGVDYPTDAQIDTKIAAALAQRNQLEPLRAESEDWLNENGDPTKVYIVPNADGQGGKVYAYAEVEGEVTKTLKDAVCGPETQQINHWVADAGYSTASRIGSDGTVKSGTDQASGYIPAAVGATIKVENFALTKNQTCYVAAYDDSGAVTGSQLIQNTNNGSEISTAATSNKWCDTKTASSFTATLSAANFGSGFTKIRINGVLTNATVTVATVQKLSRWYAFTDFVDTNDARINAIDDRVKVLEAGGASRIKTREAALRLIKEWDKPIYDQLEPFMLDHTLSVDSSRWATYYDADDKDGSKRRAQVSALYEEYDALCTNYPDFVRDITNVTHGLEGATETTYGGLCSDGVQMVKVYEFKEVDPLRNEANNEWSETKPKMLLISGIHWEWGGVYALFNALKEITTNPALRYIRRNMHFVVMPITNPYTFTNFGNTNDGHYNKNGVEIHNNFEVDFNNVIDATHGKEPLSEIETRYINNVMRKHSDAAYMVSCHSHQGNSKTPNRTIWPSTATYFGCNLGYRLIDMMSFALSQKYNTDWSGDNRAGHASLSSSSGTEGKQAMLYGIHGMSLEIGDTFYAFSADKLSDYVITHGAETYINFIRIAMTAYSIHDREQYAPKPAYEIE